jgi:hypothetical protein
MQICVLYLSVSGYGIRQWQTNTCSQYEDDPLQEQRLQEQPQQGQPQQGQPILEQSNRFKIAGDELLNYCLKDVKIVSNSLHGCVHETLIRE